jgi:hypothetical protein
LAALGDAGAVWRVPALGGRPQWLARGQLDRSVGLLIITSIAVSSLALVTWFALTKPDYTQLVGSLFPRLPVPLLIRANFLVIASCASVLGPTLSRTC